MEIIYIRLLEEGIEVWRPVQATKKLNSGHYYIEDYPVNNVPDGEIWEFLPGTSILIEESFSEGKLIKKAIRKV